MRHAARHIFNYLLVTLHLPLFSLFGKYIPSIHPHRLTWSPKGPSPGYRSRISGSAVVWKTPLGYLTLPVFSGCDTIGIGVTGLGRDRSGAAKLHHYRHCHRVHNRRTDCRSCCRIIPFSAFRPLPLPSTLTCFTILL